GRRLAIFGISSPRLGCGISNTHSEEVAASSKSKCFLIEPPRARVCTVGWKPFLSTLFFPKSFLSGTGLPVLIEVDVVRCEVGKNCSAQFENVHSSQILVENFTVGARRT